MHLFLTTSLGLTFLFGSRRVKTKKRAPEKTFLCDNKEKKRKKRNDERGAVRGKTSTTRNVPSTWRPLAFYRKGRAERGSYIREGKIRRFGDNVMLYYDYMDQDDGTLERALAMLYKQDKENLKVLIKELLKYDAKRR
jgi:hypothetical protein